MTTAIDNRGGPAHRHAEDGDLVYLHPVTGERFLSVTSALDYIRGDGLNLYWRPGLAAKHAFAELPRLVAATRVKRCGRAYKRCSHDFRVSCVDCPCGDCRDCLTREMAHRHFAESGRRADEGSKVHNWIKDWVLSGGQRSAIEPALKPYIDAFLAFIADYGLTVDSFEMCEATVLNRSAKHGSYAGWGGTLDAQIRFDGTATPAALKLCRKFGLARPLLTVDWKSREGEGAEFYPNNAKQLATYRRGEVVLFDDGREVPLPATDGAVVVQLRLTDGHSVRPVVTDDDTYEAFLANFRSAVWEIERGTKATQVKSFPDLDIPDLPVEPPKPARRSATRAASTPARKSAPAKVASPAAPRRTVAERIGATSYARPAGATLTDSDIPF